MVSPSALGLNSWCGMPCVWTPALLTNVYWPKKQEELQPLLKKRRESTLTLTGPICSNKLQGSVDPDSLRFLRGLGLVLTCFVYLISLLSSLVVYTNGVTVLW